MVIVRIGHLKQLLYTIKTSRDACVGHRIVIPLLQKLRQENCEKEADLGYPVKSCITKMVRAELCIQVLGYKALSFQIHYCRLER